MSCQYFLETRKLATQTSSSAMAERRRDACSATLSGWVTLRLNFGLKGYWLLDGRMVILQLCRWKFSQKKNFVADFIRLKLHFVKKTKKSLFEPPFGGLRGNVHIPPIVRWQACGRLPVRHNWTFPAISYGWDVISGNLSKSAFFEGGGSFELKFQTEGGVAHQPLSMSEN